MNWSKTEPRGALYIKENPPTALQAEKNSKPHRESGGFAESADVT